MIKYTLQCDDAHTFEGWFRNSDDFDSQCKRNLVACPMCGSNEVRKGLMAPAVSTARAKAALVDAARAEMRAHEASAKPDAMGQAGGEGGAVAMQSSALLPKDLQQKEIVEALRLVRARIIENSENVGADFASEARKIHNGEAEERSIYGETTPKDAEALMEEGIAVFPLPDLPDDKN
ncbi:DUF1178 family protein [Roseibium sediminicola]|uniref:DUF1178 family protein n=1 Tax=Roseibium sediminicola TaxID=2933272 RepID=A0ABT0GSW7_9HYPH|nr:DUF1178 family protein [Roseibium sp. CAU 1639]